MRRIKVMHLLSRIETGGLENGVINLSNNVDRSKIEPMVCCIHGMGTMRARLKQDVVVVDMGCAPGFRVSNFSKLRKCFKEYRPDVLHTHGWGQGSLYGVIAGRWANVPVIINGEHGGFFVKDRQIVAQRLLSRLCHATLSVSETLKQEIKHHLGISAERIIAVPNGVDREVFNGKHDTSALVTEIRNRTGIAITPDDHVIVSVARLTPVKNHPMILEAVEILNKGAMGPQCKVILAGDGPDRAMLQDMVRAKKLQQQVVFLGDRQDIQVILSLAHVLVLASRHEGMSNVVLEAMSSGKPVISTKTAGADELIREGENGYVVAQNDAEAMARHLYNLFNSKDLYTAVCAGAHTYVADNYSMTAMVDAYTRIYAQLMEKRSPSAQGER